MEVLHEDVYGILEWDPETKLYVGFVPGFQVHIHKGKAWTNCRRIERSSELCLEESRMLAKIFPRFIGLQQIEVAG